MPLESQTNDHTFADDTRVGDHLANERTYLAWTRTGISAMGFGIVIARLRYIFPPNSLQPPSSGIVHAANLGLLFTVIGLLTVVFAAWRFREVRSALRKRNYVSSLSVVMGFSAVIVVLGILIIGYLVRLSV